MSLGGDLALGLWGGVVGRSCFSWVLRRCCREVIFGCGEVLLGGVVG